MRADLATLPEDFTLQKIGVFVTYVTCPRSGGGYSYIRVHHYQRNPSSDRRIAMLNTGVGFRHVPARCVL